MTEFIEMLKNWKKNKYGVGYYRNLVMNYIIWHTDEIVEALESAPVIEKKEIVEEKAESVVEDEVEVKTLEYRRPENKPANNYQKNNKQPYQPWKK